MKMAEAGTNTGGVSKTRTALYSAASVGTGAFFAFNNFVLPPILKAFGAPDLLIGLLSSTRSIEGAVVQPVIGTVSDRIWTPLGRRRPFLVFGVSLSAVFFLTTAKSPNLVALSLGIFLFSIFFNVAADPYVALLADIAPLEQRSLLSGIATAVQLASQVAFLAIVSRVTGNGNVPAWTYVAVASALLVSFAVTVIGVPEPKERAEPVEHIPLKKYVTALRSERAAVNYLGTLFVYQFGLNAILPYLVLFAVDDIHQTQQIGFALAALVILITAITAVGFGKLADLIGTRPVLVIGWLLLGIGATGGAFMATLAQTIIVLTIAGIGNGAATAVSWPLLTALIRPEQTGVFAGLKAAAESVATPLSVVVASELFIPHLGYRGIFALLAVSIGLALVLLVRFVPVPAPSAVTLMSTKETRAS
jgi:maltose/moltooligosaccharide transporter